MLGREQVGEKKQAFSEAVVDAGAVGEGGEVVSRELAGERDEADLDVAEERGDIGVVEELLPALLQSRPAAEAGDGGGRACRAVLPDADRAEAVEVVRLLLKRYRPRPAYICKPPKRPSTACPLIESVKS